MARLSKDDFTEEFIDAQGLRTVLHSVMRDADATEDEKERYELFFQFFLDAQFEPGAAQELAQKFAAAWAERQAQRTRH